MAERDMFIEDMVRQLDATILVLGEREAALAEVLGQERLEQIEDYRAGRLAWEERDAFERSLNSLDREWMATASRLQRAREHRAMAGRSCMEIVTPGKQPD